MNIAMNRNMKNYVKYLHLEVPIWGNKSLANGMQ